VAMRLAEYVEHTVDVDQMLDRMSTQQFTEWCAKDAIEPIGEEKTRVILGMIGIIVAKFAGVNLSERDFTPWVEIDPGLSQDGLKAQFEGMGEQG